MNVEELKQLLHEQNEEILHSKMPEIINGVMALYEKGIAVGMKIGGQIKVKQACEWLKLNTNWDDEWDEMGRNMNYGKIEDFRKAMEEKL